MLQRPPINNPFMSSDVVISFLYLIIIHIEKGNDTIAIIRMTELLNPINNNKAVIPIIMNSIPQISYPLRCINLSVFLAFASKKSESINRKINEAAYK